MSSLLSLCLCSQLCRCESSLPGWTGGICLAVFKAEVLVSFKKPESSDSQQPALREPRCRWIISVLSLSPPRPWLSAPWLAFAVKPNRVIPAVKSLELKVHAFSTLETRSTPLLCFSSSFSACEKGLRCILFSSVALTKLKKKAKKNKNKASEWENVSKMDMCCTYWCVLLAKERNRLALSLAIKIIL